MRKLTIVFRLILVTLFQLLTLSAHEDRDQTDVDLVCNVSGPSMDDFYYRRLHTPLDLASCFEGIDILVDGRENSGTLSGIRARLMIRRNGKYYLLLMQRTKNVFELYDLKSLKGDMFLSGDSVRDFESPILYERLKAVLPPFQYDEVKMLSPSPRTSILIEDNTRPQDLKGCFDGFDLLFDGVSLDSIDCDGVESYFLLKKGSEKYVVAMLSQKNVFLLYYGVKQQRKNEVLLDKAPVRTFESAELYKRIQCRLKSSCSP